MSEPIVKTAIHYEERLSPLADAFDSEANAASLILLRKLRLYFMTDAYCTVALVEPDLYLRDNDALKKPGV